MILKIIRISDKTQKQGSRKKKYCRKNGNVVFAYKILKGKIHSYICLCWKRILLFVNIKKFILNWYLNTNFLSSNDFFNFNNTIKKKKHNNGCEEFANFLFRAVLTDAIQLLQPELLIANATLKCSFWEEIKKIS